MPKLIEVPDDLAELLANPEQITRALHTINALLKLEVVLVPPNNVAPLVRGQSQIRGEPPNLTLPIPLQAPNSWAAATGTATRTTFATSTVTLAQLAERVKALQDDLIATRILPTS